jgi:hypothetical protein
MVSSTKASSSVFPARRSARLATSAVFAFGTATWLALAALAREREAWDSPLYFAVVPVLSIVVGVVAGWRCGGPGWRWPLAFFGGQLALLLARGDASLWPLSLAFLFALALPCWLAASLAVRVRERVR